MPATPLILASTSPYRRALLQRLRLSFTCVPPEIGEDPRAGEAPQALATRLAQEKALAVSRRHPAALVLGSDQVASLDAALFGKPGSAEAARRQLARCSGHCVRFDTAVALAQDHSLVASRCVAVDVQFRHLTAAEIARYVEVDTPLDCAGSFRWESLGVALFERLVSDDPTALEGLPLIAVCDMLRAAGINPLDGTHAPVSP